MVHKLLIQEFDCAFGQVSYGAKYAQSWLVEAARQRLTAAALIAEVARHR